jgi:hypothetical protein
VKRGGSHVLKPSQTESDNEPQSDCEPQPEQGQIGPDRTGIRKGGRSIRSDHLDSDQSDDSDLVKNNNKNNTNIAQRMLDAVM